MHKASLRKRYLYLAEVLNEVVFQNFFRIRRNR